VSNRAGDIGAKGALEVSTTSRAFRDGFTDTTVTQPNPAYWDITSSSTDHIIEQGGNSGAAAYLRISLSPFDDGSGVRLVSKQDYRMPVRVGLGTSISQRIVGQEVFTGVIGEGQDGQVDYDTVGVPDVALSGTASVTSNVATITINNHTWKGGDRVIIFGASDHRMNVGPVQLTVVDRNNITVPITIANGTYGLTGGTMRYCDFARGGRNAYGLLFENNSTTQASIVTKRNGSRQRILVGQPVATTTATQVRTDPFTDAFVAGSINELVLTNEEASYRSWTADSVGGVSGLAKFTQGTPDEDNGYRVIIRARNLDGLTKPIARITAASKTGTTTATVTTDVPHNLAVGDWVQLTGARDVTNYPNLAASQIASVVNATSFTIVWGGAVTASTAGGTVWVVQGQVAAPGLIGQTVQSISRANNILSLTGNTTWSGVNPGDRINLHGLEGTNQVYEGSYKVLRLSTTTLEVDAPGADLGSQTTGGTVIRRTDVRVHFVRVLDYNRLTAEIVGGRGNANDSNNAVPVTISSSTNLTIGALTSGTSAGNLGKAEDAAHASGDTGVAILGVRANTTPAARTSAADDYGTVAIDAEGKVITANTADSANTWQAVANPVTAATNVALKAAAAAGIRNYVTDLTFENTTAAAVGYIVQDATTTIYRITVPAGTSITKVFQTPLRGTAATAMNVQIGTTVAGAFVSGSGYIGV
jgi:hypothetical protein